MSEDSWSSNLIRARHLEPHARYVRSTCIHSRMDNPSPNTPVEGPKDPRLAIYVSSLGIPCRIYTYASQPQTDTICE